MTSTLYTDSVLLTSNQIKFLETITEESDLDTEELRFELEQRNVDGSYAERPDKLKTETKERARKLPAELTTLLKTLSLEIELLNKAGHLTPRIKYGVYEKVGATTDSELSNESPLAELGLQFGTLCRQLLFAPKTMEREEVYTEVVWGFLQGVTQGSPSSGVDCSERLRERAQTRMHMVEEGLNNLSRYGESIGECIDREYRRIEAVLEDQEIAFEECLPGAILDQIKRDYGIRSPKAIPLTAVEHIESVEEAIRTDRVLTIIEDQRLVEKRRLIDLLDQCIETIDEVDDWDTVSAPTVLQAVPKDEAITSRELARSIATAGKTTAVLKIGLYLAGSGDIHGETWDRPPLIDIAQDGPFGGEEWTRTPLGQVLFYVPIDPPLPFLHTDTEIHARLHSIPDDVTTDAIDWLATDG